MGILSIFIYLIIILLPIVYKLIQKRYTYWKKFNIPYAEPDLIFSARRLNSNRPYFEHIQDIFDEFKEKSLPLVGVYIFFKPTIILLNLDMVKHVFIKDFSNFTDRCFYYNEKDDPISAHLFALDGHHWQELRKKFTPTFTSGKMKFMFPTIVEVGERFSDVFTSIVKNGNDIAIKELLARYTTDVIGTCAFGIDCNSLKDPNAEFRLKGRRIVTDVRHGRCAAAFLTYFPEIARKFGVKVIPDDISEFFMKAVRDTVAFREQNNVRRNDFMDILIQLKNEKVLGKDDGTNQKLTIEQVGAQAFLFYLAGFETSSTAMGFCLYELAKHQNVQDKLREEINEVLNRNNGVLTYENMNNMHYLEQVLCETLRKYPIGPVITRKALFDYEVPDTDYTIPKNTLILVPVRSFHYDSDIYPDPEKFDPERFTPEAIQNRHPQAFLSFGDGPRKCIGLRFGKMQAKIGLINLLKNFKFTCCDKTFDKVIYDPKIFLLINKDDIILRVDKV